MTNFMKRGGKFFVTPESSINIQKELPVGTYNLNFNPDEGFYLSETNPLKNPKKVYGDVYKNSDRILNTYQKEQKNLGVMLAGYKGSGKTLLGREVSIKAHQKGIPTIIINDPFSGTNFIQFFNMIHQPCIVFIDEYEKMYNDRNENVNALLSLLDGAEMSNKLFIMTCNEINKVSEYLKNRPSRVRYMMNFDKIEYDVILEIAKDILDKSDRVEEIANYLSALPRMSFDKIVAFCKEVNYYNESCTDVMEIINIDKGADFYGSYNIKVFYKSKDVSPFFNDIDHDVSLDMKSIEEYCLDFSESGNHISSWGDKKSKKVYKDKFTEEFRTEFIEDFNNITDNSGYMYFEWKHLDKKVSNIDPTGRTLEKFVFVDGDYTLVIKENPYEIDKSYMDYI